MKSTARKNTALIELVLVILFLALSAAILAQAFAKARTMSADSRAQTTGMVWAQDVIEQWKADPAAIQRLFPADEGWTEQTGGERVFTAVRDENMQRLDGERPPYILSAAFAQENTAEGTIYTIRVTVTSGREGAAEPLVDYETAIYLSDGRA